MAAGSPADPAPREASALDAVVKAYDVRGLVPEQFGPELARALGAAFVEVLRIRQEDGGPGAVVVGQDMRPSGDELVTAFAEGVCGQGCDVIRIGLASTDGLYFASGDLELPGAMFTASHNPAEYNGIKFCRAGAAPVGMESGLREMRDLVEAGVPAYAGATGTVARREMLPAYAQFLRGLVDLSAARPLAVVIDAGNGMAGLTAPAVLGQEAGLPALPLRVTPLYFELDGTFPNHEANPIEPDNLRDLQRAVVAQGADLGLAFDGDADRCFVIDERGVAVTPSAITALIAERELSRHPGATIIYNCISSRTVPEVIAEHGGVGVRTRVGHSFIKARMAQTGAVFGGEHSGHFYFTDFWRADSGMLAAMHVLDALGSAPPGTTLSSLLARYDRYVASGEINSVVDDAAAATERVREAYAGQDEVTFDDLDGMTVSAPDWWFNLRPSNTEPLLRLNVEAKDAGTMESVRDEVLAIVRGA
jgi:phosphomannomutase